MGNSIEIKQIFFLDTLPKWTFFFRWFIYFLSDYFLMIDQNALDSWTRIKRMSGKVLKTFWSKWSNRFKVINVKASKLFLPIIHHLHLGWMILVILIYHITGGDKHLPLYMHTRVLISSYIFLAGYEHFQYMWKLPHNSTERNKTLFIRFIQVGHFSFIGKTSQSNATIFL